MVKSCPAHRCGTGASGNIDVGATGLTAGLYNSVVQGMKIAIVADKGRDGNGSG